jgi:hypothetical protein
MDNQFTWPADLPDWQSIEPKFTWRGMKPNGEGFYSVAKPDMFFNGDGLPAAWISFSEMHVGKTSDAEAADNWANSLQRRNQVYWYINNEYQVVQYDAEANSDITAEFLCDNEYSAYLNLSEMADDIFLSALSEMDIAAKIRARFFEYIKSKNQKP